VNQNRQQQVYFGARGISALEITVFGPNHEIHSGHYGNWAPNPAMMLARLLTSMKNEDGRVLVKSFYDGIEPLGPTEKRALASAPNVDGDLRNELGIGWTEGAGRSLADLINEPSLNVNGLLSAAVGPQARNVIPSKAIASIDCRLVKGMDPKRTFEQVVAHVRQQGYTVETRADAKPHGAKFATVVYKTGYAAARTSMDLAISKEVVAAIEKVRGPVVRMPTLGGSVPLYIFEQELHTPMIGIPIANHDNNQHSANENIRLQNLWDGIETMAALMTM
jgi:acetylornithine deacetylase/succinyl-diaminopimelate desuccinylase-like protein